ncbi:hypothetical protein Snas_3957 [Stackebrandtia nassauensis DSM 44728]|uniref:Uncharacterized protein n=2 Tax=Stackebrandtia TaxID=283810 RepID=D3PZS2_STANL|nr:hypothetical protein Snas_3957 [Stackebrandtia nassauensis DSM 44728]
MKLWIPIAVTSVAVVSGAAWITLVGTSERGPFVEGLDPGEVACVDLISGDLLTLPQDDYLAWSTDVYELARSAAESRDYGVVTAADVIVDDYDDGEISPIELHFETSDFADACAAADFVSETQVYNAKQR